MQAAGVFDRATAYIDLDAVRSNVATLRERAPDARLMAVVKADGYGHGALPVARAALAAGADWLGTALISEGLALRAAGLRAPSLSWLSAPGDQWAAAVRAGIDVSASAEWAVAEAATAAAEVGRPARLHLKVDTGLGRAGSQPHDWPALVDAALKAEADGLVQVVGVWTHLACAD